MNNSSIVLRIINVRNGEAMDWTVHPGRVTFIDAIKVICRVLQNNNVSAFEYDDEDNERITVRSEEEMSNMVQEYVSSLGNGSSGDPLMIYPRVGKDPEKRNIHGLKVQIDDSGGNQSDCSAMEQGQDSGSRKQASGDIREILAQGVINGADLKYQACLGKGAAGTVYKAFHLPSSSIISVKEISLNIDEEEQKRIISELEILYKCHSPYIITFYGGFFSENKISICTEYMDGGSLDKYRKVEEFILGRVAVAVLKGLNYLWSMKIMHRDVKPSNILVNTSGLIKLCDFGVSVRLIDSIAKTYVGTNAYMAPERIKGEEYRIQSEVWSVGLSLFELAIGSFPYKKIHYETTKPGELTKCIVEETPPELPIGEFTEPFIHFVQHCLMKDPQCRADPQTLMQHPFVLQFVGSDNTVVSDWVRTRLSR